MERTFSFDARAVVPTTLGFTSAMPSAGSASTNVARTTSGTAVADRRHPRRAQRAQQKVRAAQDEIRERQRAAEAHAVGQRAAEDGEKPDQSAEESSERAGLLERKLQSLVQIARQRSEGGVVGEPLEELADVGDPEGPLEAGADVVPTLGEGHVVVGSQLSVVSQRSGDRLAAH